MARGLVSADKKYPPVGQGCESGQQRAISGQRSSWRGSYSAAMTEFLSCRPNLEVADLAPAAAFLRDVLGFQVEVDEPAMGLMLLSRDAVGLALVRSANPGVNSTTAVYIGVTGVDDLHERCIAREVPIVTGLADHPWGLRDFVVEMPGGHRLALGER